MIEIDQIFEQAGRGPVSLQGWMTAVEIPLRRSLRDFASVVDVESVMQDALMQMWVMAQGDERPSLSGENASIWLAIDRARNIARDEARRAGCEALLPTDGMPDPDEILRPDQRSLELEEALYGCKHKQDHESLPTLRWRLELPGLPDATVTKYCGMPLHIFSRAVTGATRRVAHCLEHQGIVLEGWNEERDRPGVDEGPEAWLGTAASAYRDTGLDGRPMPPQGWWEAPPDYRERAYWLRLMTNQMESLSGTMFCVQIRIIKTLPRTEKAQP